MSEAEIALLKKLGFLITSLEYEHSHVNLDGRKEAPRDAIMPITTRGEFMIDDNVFGPMLRLVKIVDMICESDNEMVQEQFEHLITLLNLTEKK